MQDRLIHGDALVDRETVWGVIQHSLPALRAAVDGLLRELDSWHRAPVVHPAT